MGLLELLFQLVLSLVLRDDDDQIWVELVNWQQLRVVIEYIDDLARVEERHEVDQEVSVILKNRNAEHLENMLNLKFLLDNSLNHDMKWVLFLLFRVQVALDDLNEHLHQ